jgi:hypothetical protein
MRKNEKPQTKANCAYVSATRLALAQAILRCYSRSAFLMWATTSPGNLAALQLLQSPLGASLRAVEVEDGGIFSPPVSPALCPQGKGSSVTRPFH